METKVCKVCERELPLADFPVGKGGVRIGVCKECRTAALRETQSRNRARSGGGKTAPFSDPDFDGKEPREVIEFMSRAKRWLESRGYAITLKGTFTQVREIKF